MYRWLNICCRIPLYLVRKDLIACQEGLVCELPSNGRLEGKRSSEYD